MLTISACVITKNEEVNIVKWLECMKKLANEIIVVDTGSTDKTVKIAESYGAKVFFFEWINDFSAAKNFAKAQAKGDWIVFLDADEYFSDDSIEQVKKYLIEDNKKYDAIICEIVNINSDDCNRIISSFYNLRIFRNIPKLSYHNKVHEMLRSDSGTLLLLQLPKDVKIYHTGYSSSIIKEKLTRNLKLIEEDQRQNGIKDWHYGFLCDCYYGLDDFEKTIEYAKLAINSDMKLIGQENNLYRRLIDSLDKLGKNEKEILEIVEIAIEKFPELPEFILDKAILFLRQKKYVLAESLLLETLRQKEADNYNLSDTFIGKKHIVYTALGDIQYFKNKIEKAVDYYINSLKIYKYNEYTLRKLYNIFKKENEIDFIEILNVFFSLDMVDLEFLYEVFKDEKLGLYYKYKINKKEILANDVSKSFELYLGEKYYEAIQNIIKDLDMQYKLIVINYLLSCDKNLFNQLNIILPSQYKILLDNINKNDVGDSEIALLSKIKMEYEKFNNIRGKDMCDNLISIVVFSDNTIDSENIDIIKEYTNNKFELILVNNNATSYENAECINEYENQADGFNKALKRAKGQFIMFLDNAIIVTPNYMDKMLEAFVLNDKVGAVGPLFNNIAGQAIDGCKGKESLVEYSKMIENNNKHIYSKRLSLHGSCLLLKKEVVNDVGKFDYNMENMAIWDDLSCRLILAGYNLILSADTYVFNLGEPFLRQSYSNFIKKWGFDFFYSNGCRFDLLNMMNLKLNKINILEIGCACGGTLLEISNRNNTANLYGIEINKNAANIAKMFANVSSADIENGDLPYERLFFDYVIFGDVLEHLYNPQKVLENIKPYLKEDGKIIASIPNIQHWTIIEELLNGYWTYTKAGILDETHLRFFTQTEITKMFDEAGYNVKKYVGNDIGISESGKTLLEKMLKCNIIDNVDDFMAYQWFVEADKKYIIDGNDEKELAYLLRRIDNETAKEDSFISIMKFIIDKNITTKILLNLIEVATINKTAVIIFIAVNLYQKGESKIALEFLIHAYKKYNDDLEIVYSLAYILNLNGDKNSAIKLLESQSSSDKSTKELLAELKGELG